MKTDVERKKELERLIQYHRDLYYNRCPTISDAEFDGLKEELRLIREHID